MDLTAHATETILKYGIKPYGDISSDEKNGRPAHHLVEKRFWRQLGFEDKEQAQNEILAVVIDPDVHGPEGKGESTLTDMLRDSIGHQLSNDADPQDIWNAHRDVYRKAGHNDWADLIWEVYFQDMDIEKE